MMNRIKELRKSRCITMEQLAMSMNVNKSTVSRWENEKILPTVENWQALANYFNVSVPYIKGEIFCEDLSDHQKDIYHKFNNELCKTDLSLESEIKVLSALLNGRRSIQEGIRS